MVIHHDVMPVLNRINEHMKLKKGYVGDLDLYAQSLLP